MRAIVGREEQGGYHHLAWMFDHPSKKRDTILQQTRRPIRADMVGLFLKAGGKTS